jgi:hypothetical protein
MTEPPHPGPAWRRLAVRAAATLLILACDPMPMPTEPTVLPELPGDATLPARQGQSQLFSDRARLIDPAQFALVSSPEDHAAGRYRYRVGDQPPEPIDRDDFLVSSDGDAFVRRVLSSQVVGNELVLETGPAYWSDVINSGTYGITMPLSPGSGPAQTYNGLSLAPITIGPATVPLPPLETTFPRTDICKWIEDLLASLPGDHPPDVCGKERDFEVGTGVTVRVAGTLDSLLILGGHLAVTGNMDIDMTVDAGGISGGRAPRFYPCYKAAYLGCLTTPTGAAFIDWIRQYLPALPEASLPPVRVCVPGLPVRTKAGYWYWVGWTPYWSPPVYEKCSVSDWGELPTITLPSFTRANSEIRPFIKGDITFKVKGDGSLGLKVGIPALSASAAYVIGNDFKAKASIGLFVGLSVSLKNTGATILVTFEDSVKAGQTWTPSAGWDGDFQVTYNNNSAQFVALDNPDSILVRVSVPLEVGAELCVAIVACEEEKPKTATAPASGAGGPNPATQGLFDIAIGAKAKAAVSMFEEGVWNRQIVNPADSTVDNWNVDIDGAYDFTLEAGVKIPFTGWILPGVPREWKKTWEWGRVSMGDLWGRGHLLVSAATTGTSPDPDGYEVTVARYDTLPVVIESGATRLGKARDHGEPLDLPLGATDSVVFSPGFGPCYVWYTDALFFGNPVWGSALAGLRAAGVGVPTYAITANCRLLIGRYTVTLTGVSDNCAVTGGPVNDAVWLRQKNLTTGQSDTTRVHFAVVCNGTDALGALQITTQAATMPDYAHDYQIAIDGLPRGAIGPNATDTLTGLSAGTHNVALSGGPSNCGAPEATDVTVPAGGLASVTLIASPCFLPDTYTPGEVTVAATTTGAGTDADGYQVKLDGVLRAAMAVNDPGTVSNVPALVPSVIQVSNLAGNCRATGLNPFVVTLDADATSIAVPFGADCTASVIDTVRGLVESTTWPTPSVSVRQENGSVRGLTGVSSADLLQLSGAAVRVWGITSGTTTELYGYQLLSTLGDPRWVGMVTIRGSQVWLFGEDAVQLIDVSPSLQAAAGALVWVSGTQDAAGVRPTAFGVIREAQP